MDRGGYEKRKVRRTTEGSQKLKKKACFVEGFLLFGWGEFISTRGKKK